MLKQWCSRLATVITLWTQACQYNQCSSVVVANAEPNILLAGGIYSSSVICHSDVNNSESHTLPRPRLLSWGGSTCMHKTISEDDKMVTMRHWVDFNNDPTLMRAD